MKIGNKLCKILIFDNDVIKFNYIECHANHQSLVKCVISRRRRWVPLGII